MKQTMSLDEFEDFCKDKTEIRYISTEEGHTDLSYKLRIAFSAITVVPNEQRIYLSSDNASLSLLAIKEVTIKPGFFGDAEAEIIGGDMLSNKVYKLSILFAP